MTSKYYDAYADRQVRVGINARHRSILRWLKRFGLEPGLDVLEIGCGVGAVTELIARRIGRRGALLGVDLSPRSIELARLRLRRWPGVELLAADALDLELDRTFDVIVLPDVLEHIPMKDHVRLFANIRAWLRETGWVLVHMPNPFFLEWCQQNRPELLQEIDQPIFLDTLVAAGQPNGLYVSYLETYSIWAPKDYQVVVLRPPPGGGFDPSRDQPLREDLLHRARRAVGLAAANIRRVTIGGARRS